MADKAKCSLEANSEQVASEMFDETDSVDSKNEVEAGIAETHEQLNAMFEVGTGRELAGHRRKTPRQNR